jgi:Na+/melibiose symporter-like transporter
MAACGEARPTLSDAAVYLLAHFAKSQLWHASTLLFGFFLTEACGMEAAMMGVVMAGSLLVNGLADALIGRWWGGAGDGGDRGLRTGLRRQGWSAVVTCLFFLAFCATPLLPPAYRLGWALVSILAFRISYACLDVPQNAAVAVVALDRDARCALLARRNIASGLANLAVALTGAPLLIHGRGTAAWLGWAVGISLLVCATAFGLHRLALLARVEGRTGASRHEERGEHTGSRHWRALLGILALMMLACSTFRSIEPYYAAFVGKGVGLLAWAAVGSIMCQPVWVACRRRLGAAATLAAIAALLLAGALILLGPGRDDPVGAALVGLAFGAGASGVWLMLWTTMMVGAHAADVMGRVGTFTCVSKVAQGAALLLSGQVLAASPYRATLADAGSAPSLLMAVALVAIAVAGLALLLVRDPGGMGDQSNKVR